MGWTNVDRNTVIRLKSFGLAALDYAVNIMVLYVYAYILDIIPPSVPHQILLIAIVFNVTFFYMIASQLTLRFKDPSITSLQVAAAMFINFYAMYHASQIAYVFLVNIFIPLAYSSLIFNRTQFFTFTCGISATLFYMVFVLDVPINMALDSSGEKLMACMVFALSLLRYNAITAQVSLLRHRLHKKNKSLKEVTEQLSMLASHDELTGAFNRRYFIEHLESVHNDIKTKHTGTYCIAILDADHFKQVNDRYGHLVGDEVLKVLAQRFQVSLRSHDILARYGGEEFAVLLPGATLGDGYGILSRMLKQIESHGWKSVFEGGAVTCSAGVAEFRPGKTAKQILSAADQALYKAKNTGRNRVCRAPNPKPIEWPGMRRFVK